MIPEVERKEFWEKCGLSKRGGYWWYDMQGNHLTADSPPPIDLNNLFKYAVPKVAKTSEIRIVIPPNTEGRFLVGIGHQENVEDVTLALALFRAIQQVFKEAIIDIVQTGNT